MKPFSRPLVALGVFWLTALLPAYGQDRVPRYPLGFHWGAAFSAHQTEGVAGGGEAGDWYRFEHSTINHGQSPIRNGDTADLAVDYWNRFDEDFRVARSLNLDTLRTSIAWEKIEPAPGVFSSRAMAHYRAQFQRMRDLGIRPMIALHHFTHPQWFHDRGGWLSPDSPALFLRYASYVVQNLGDLCDLWITFNEPMILVTMGYLKAEVPPLLSSLDASFEAAYNIARAHRMTTAMIHERQGMSRNARGRGRGRDAFLRGVGLANALPVFDPADPANAKDREAADVLSELNNWAFIRGVETGRMKFDIPAEVPGAKSFDRVMPESDIPPWLRGTPMMDWIGVNYYTRYLIRYDAKNSLRVNWITPSGPASDNDWAIQPAGLERILRQTAARFRYPLVVSENGLSDASDRKRPQFIRDHLKSLDGAIGGGPLGPPLDVRGYYHWSLMDNFEWLSGYAYRFGLVEIRYRDGLRRVPRPSAKVFRDEMQRRSP